MNGEERGEREAFVTRRSSGTAGCAPPSAARQFSRVPPETGEGPTGGSRARNSHRPPPTQRRRPIGRPALPLRRRCSPGARLVAPTTLDDGALCRLSLDRLGSASAFVRIAPSPIAFARLDNNPRGRPTLRLAGREAERWRGLCQPQPATLFTRTRRESLALAIIKRLAVTRCAHHQRPAPRRQLGQKEARSPGDNGGVDGASRAPIIAEAPGDAWSCLKTLARLGWPLFDAHVSSSSAGHSTLITHQTGPREKRPAPS